MTRRRPKAPGFSAAVVWCRRVVLLVLLLAVLLTTHGLVDASSLTARGCDAQPLGDRRAVILIHGLTSDPSIWEELLHQICNNGRLKTRVKPYAFSYPSVLIGDRTTTRMLADQLQGDIDRSELRGMDVILIGHSLGGLVGRSYMQEHAGGDRVRLLITLATPHRGTHEQADVNVLALVGAAMVTPWLLGELLTSADASAYVVDLQQDAVPANSWLRCLNSYRGSSLPYRHECRAGQGDRDGHYSRVVAYSAPLAGPTDEHVIPAQSALGRDGTGLALPFAHAYPAATCDPTGGIHHNMHTNRCLFSVNPRVGMVDRVVADLEQAVGLPPATTLSAASTAARCAPQSGNTEPHPALEPDHVILRGTVKSASPTATVADWPQMQALVGATVSAVEWQRTTTTGPDGSYCLDGRPGPVTIQVTASAHHTYRQTVSLGSSSTTRNIGLRQERGATHVTLPAANGGIPIGPAPVTLRGVIRSASPTATAADWSQMQPLGGAIERITEWNATTTTGPDGSYALRGPAGAVTIEASASGHHGFRRAVSLTSDTSNGNIALRQAATPVPPSPVSSSAGSQPPTAQSVSQTQLATLQGMVIGTDGVSNRRLPGATVVVLEWRQQVTTASDGTYVLRGPAGWITIQVSAPGYQGKSQRALLAPGTSSGQTVLPRASSH